MGSSARAVTASPETTTKCYAIGPKRILLVCSLPNTIYGLRHDVKIRSSSSACIQRLCDVGCALGAFVGAAKIFSGKLCLSNREKRGKHSDKVPGMKRIERTKFCLRERRASAVKSAAQ